MSLQNYFICLYHVLNVTKLEKNKYVVPIEFDNIIPNAYYDLWAIIFYVIVHSDNDK